MRAQLVRDRSEVTLDAWLCGSGALRSRFVRIGGITKEAGHFAFYVDPTDLLSAMADTWFAYPPELTRSPWLKILVEIEILEQEENSLLCLKNAEDRRYICIASSNTPEILIERAPLQAALELFMRQRQRSATQLGQQGPTT